MAYNTGLADSRAMSQSDSNLLSSSRPRPSEQVGSMRRNSSVDDMDTSKRGKGFLYRLVRPWKWHRKKKKNSKSDSSGQNSGECIYQAVCVCLTILNSVNINVSGECLPPYTYHVPLDELVSSPSLSNYCLSVCPLLVYPCSHRSS